MKDLLKIIGTYIVIMAVIILAVFLGTAHSKTVKIGNDVFISADKTVNLVCSVTDTGVGMQDGKMKFRAAYVDGTFSTWTESEKFSTNAIVTLTDIQNGKKFNIQGMFADSLDNWILDADGPKTVEIFEFDNTPPSATSITVTIDVTITVN